MTKFNQHNTKSAKLNPTLVYEMRVKYANGQSQGSLAREYQISVGQVGKIVRGESWQQFNNPADAIQTGQRMLIPEPTKEEIAASLAKLQGMMTNPVTKPLVEESEPKYSTLDQFLTDVKEAKEGSVESKLEKFLGD